VAGAGAGAGAGALDADEELEPEDELDAVEPPDDPRDGVAEGALW